MCCVLCVVVEGRRISSKEYVLPDQNTGVLKTKGRLGVPKNRIIVNPLTNYTVRSIA